jgi:methylated-DNA-[protein]-cysteine S-methyltransferase
VDIAYDIADSPLGRLLVAVTGDGVVRIAYENEDFDAELADLAAHVSPRILVSPRRTDRARRQLDQYFEGRRTGFDLPVDLRSVVGFRRKVLDATARIPYGQVSSYRAVASAAGNERAARAAGGALGSNPVPIIVPCHRVVASDGSLGGYAGRLERKVALLRIEGFLPADQPSLLT